MKLHLGSGSVYLDGWTNVDLQAPNTFLASDRPDLVNRWKTTDANYYGRHQDKTIDTLRKGPLDQEYVCDIYGSFDNIPGNYWDCDELLARHSFEHLSITEAHKALDQIDGILKPNGILRLDVPDHEGTLQKFRETGDEFYIRHLLGPRRNDYGFHMMSYTRDRLRSLVESHGFVFVEEEPNIHLYPAFTLRFVKPGPRAPRDYIPLPEIPDNWRVLDIGPGQYPFLRANVYVDHNVNNLRPLERLGKRTIVANLMSGLPELYSGQFDFCFVSHVLEHVEDVEKCVTTLNRVAKRGVAVMPSAIKEGLFGGQEESDHKYLVSPSPREGGPPVFVRHNPEYMRKIKDAEVEKATCRLWRTGPNRLEEARYLRKFFYQHEQDLDVIVRWDTDRPLKVQVVG